MQTLARTPEFRLINSSRCCGQRPGNRVGDLGKRAPGDSCFWMAAAGTGPPYAVISHLLPETGTPLRQAATSCREAGMATDKVWSSELKLRLLCEKAAWRAWHEGSVWFYGGTRSLGPLFA